MRGIYGVFVLAAIAALAACSEDRSTKVTVVNQTTNIGTQPAKPSAPPSVRSETRGAESGKKQLIDFFPVVNPDCTVRGEATMKVTRAPAHGTTQVERTEDYPNFPKDSPRAGCNSQKVAGTTMFYTSEPGFTGVDSFTYESIFPWGGYLRVDVTVNVR